MEHLTTETLARLVDDTAGPEEQAHLTTCSACTEELQALMEQTRALASLPVLRPPRGDWSVLEARLRSEGLLKDRGVFARLGLGQTPGWMRVAASFMIFAVGAASGAGLASRAQVESRPAQVAEATDVEGAAAAVQAAEREYVQALSQYRALAARAEDLESADPISRYAALEHLVMVSQAAVRQAPGDPFLNGFLASALAERDAAARLVSTSNGGWF